MGDEKHNHAMTKKEPAKDKDKKTPTVEERHEACAEAIRAACEEHGMILSVRYLPIEPQGRYGEKAVTQAIPSLLPVENFPA